MPRTSVLLECQKFNVAKHNPDPQYHGDFSKCMLEDLIRQARIFLSFLAVAKPAELDWIGLRLSPHRIILNQSSAPNKSHRKRHRRRRDKFHDRYPGSPAAEFMVGKGPVSSTDSRQSDIATLPQQPGSGQSLYPTVDPDMTLLADEGRIGNSSGISVSQHAKDHPTFHEQAPGVPYQDPLNQVANDESISGHEYSSVDQNDEKTEDPTPGQAPREPASDDTPPSRYLQAFRLLESRYDGRNSEFLSYAEIVSVIEVGDFFLLAKPTRFLSDVREAHMNRRIWRSEFVEPSMDGSLPQQLFRSFDCASMLEQRSSSDPLRLRIARVLLYFYFVQLCKSLGLPPEHKGQTIGQGKATVAIDALLKEMYAFDQHDRELFAKRRKSFHNNKRIGKRWATLIKFLGYGVLLLCSDQTSKAINGSSFTEVMIDALINYLHLAYPRAVQLCKTSGEAALAVMKGLSSINLLDSAILNRIEAYSQASERDTHPLTGEWPSLNVMDSPIEVSIQ